MRDNIGLKSTRMIQQSMNYNKLSALVVEPPVQPTACIIFCHGLGANPQDFGDIARYLQHPNLPPIRFIFPAAPHRPVTLNSGYIMPAWYDLLGLTMDSSEDTAGILEAAEWVDDIIQALIQEGIPANRIILGGFSQGGALSLFYGLRSSVALAGLLILSTYVPLAHTLEKELTPIGQKIPIFLTHGDQDELLPMYWPEHTLSILDSHQCTYEYHVYPMGHTVCMEELLDIQQWLIKLFAPKN
jgi:phospholipase/carboxylesterase